MGQIPGKLLMCDRCKKIVFIADKNKVDVEWGWSDYKIYEREPDGWEDNIKTGLLCPECNEEYRSLINEFMDEKIITDNKGNDYIKPSYVAVEKCGDCRYVFLADEGATIYMCSLLDEVVCTESTPQTLYPLRAMPQKCRE